MPIRVHWKVFNSFRDTPIRAWKLATIAVDKTGRPRFRPMVIDTCYDAKPSTFECHCSIPRAPHTKPIVNGNCGWYALKTEQLVRREYGSSMFLPPCSYIPWLLEVDLWGTVIKCSKGYRASRQRVLSARPLNSKKGEIVWRGVFNDPVEINTWPFTPYGVVGAGMHKLKSYMPADLASAMHTDIYEK